MLKLRKGWWKINPRWYAKTEKNYYSFKWRSPNLLLKLYEQTYPNPTPEIRDRAQDLDIDFLAQDLPKLMASMQVGTKRIRQIVLSLRNFSRLDEADMKFVDIHEGLDNTLMILNHRLTGTPDRSEIQLVKKYGDLPLVECYAGQLNQVFMNILVNAINALEEASQKRSFEDLETNPNQIKLIDRETAIWLRFYDVAGNLVLLPEEAAIAREEAVVAQAARLAARLRELGENPDIL